MSSICLNLHHESATNLSVAGGKGCNLAKLIQAGFNVPPGFIVTTDAFHEYLILNHLSEYISNILSNLTSIDLSEIHQASQQICQKLAGTKIPDSIKDEIVAALAHSNYDRVAVRSSATAEDLPFASFAGQQESFLNLTSMDEILSKIMACWASLYNERSITYRIQNGIDHQTVSMAVVIQKMIPSDISGVLFTADPISNHHGHLVINAGFGLGEGLVMGLIDPDQILVEKTNHKILSMKIGEKKQQVSYDQNDGTRIEEVPEDYLTQLSLSLEQIESLTRLGIEVENFYQSPQDIEWAFSENELFLLQSRAITSLFPIPSPQPKDNQSHVYFSVGHVQMFTEPISPFGISLLQLLLPFGRSPQKVAYAPYLLQAAGRLYADVTPIINTKNGKHLLPKVLSFAEPVAGLQLQHLLQREEFQQKTTRLKVKPKIFFDWLGPLIFRTLGWLFFRNLNEVSKRTIDKSQQYMDTLSQRFLVAAIEEKLDCIKQSMSEFFHKRLIWMMGMVAAGQISRILLEKILNSCHINLNIQALQSGLEGNVTTEMDLLVGDLADLVAQEPSLHEILEIVVNNQQSYSIDLFNAFPTFKSKWCSFLERYGMRAIGELDISRPRWRDEPHTLFQIMLARANTTQRNSHRDHYQNLINKNLVIQEVIISSLKSSFRGRLMIPLVRRLINVAVSLIPLREHPKYIIMQYFQMIRREMGKISDYLIDNNRINSKDEIWFLRFDEIQSAFTNQTIDFPSIIQDRKTLYSHYRKLTPPRLITHTGEIPRIILTREGLPAGALVGSAVSAGIVEGLARVILNPAQEQLQPGEILVAPYTDPGWTPLFINAAGIVLETGGLMTHGSVVAREYGLPAVVGIADATQLIKTGMRVRVNGDQGYVEII